MRLDPTTSALFGSLPREMGNPYRIVVRSLGRMLRFVERNNGVRDIYTSVYPLNGTIDKLFFDFDGEDALREAKAVYRYLLDRGYACVPVASGKKGFHIYVLTKPMKYTDLKAKSALRKAALHIIREALGGKASSVDPHTLGNLRQMCRFPNTLRPPENLSWCCYLPPEDFLYMSEKDVAYHVKSPHVYDYDLEDRALLDLSEFDSGGDPEDSARSSNGCMGINVKGVRIAGRVHSILRSVLRPCLYRHIIMPDPPHCVRVAATVDLLRFFSPEEVFNFYKELGWDDFNPNITAYQIESCRRLKPYSCRTLRRLGIPEVCCLG